MVIERRSSAIDCEMGMTLSEDQRQDTGPVTIHCPKRTLADGKNSPADVQIYPHAITSDNEGIQNFCADFECVNNEITFYSSTRLMI